MPAHTPKPEHKTENRAIAQWFSVPNSWLFVDVRRRRGRGGVVKSEAGCGPGRRTSMNRRRAGRETVW
jgi:hypothetical protein